MFNDLCLLEGIPRSSLLTYLKIMAHKDEDAKDVAIITATRAGARAELLKFYDAEFSGKINEKTLTFEAINGTTIYFIPLDDIGTKMTGRRFKAIHFRK